jgi:hypothetical protein
VRPVNTEGFGGISSDAGEHNLVHKVVPKSPGRSELRTGQL